MGISRNSKRDWEIFARFEAGRSRELLAADYGLSGARIQDILMAQRLKRIVSPEPFYRNLRHGRRLGFQLRNSPD